MKTRIGLTLLFAAVAATLGWFTLHRPAPEPAGRAEAGRALADWYRARAYPQGRIDMAAYSRGYRQMQEKAPVARAAAAFPGTWDCIGPMNFGGRLLCLAFNPQNPNTLFAGSASGGLWRSYSGGEGPDAWEQVPTGFPVIGVAAIAFVPGDSTVLYIGTGEVYNYQQTGMGVAIRTTRGTYGIGILKSIDGGATWSTSLNWQYDDMRGVQDIVINPLRPLTAFAATTEGTYRTLDGGATWSLVSSVKMATDLLLNPADTAMLFVAAGNNNSAGNGLYKSVNGGASFVKLTTGLPSFYTGKALLAIAPSQPNILYASIAQQLIQVGLYKSVDYGDTWTLVNNEDVAMHQGWYAHDVAVRADNPDEIVFAGIDAWKSVDGGVTLVQKSEWSNWDFSATPIGGPEGPPDYVHADIHHVYYHPTNGDTVYYVTDGGLFVSHDGGETFAGANGMLHCQQFYADFSCAAGDSLFAIGGLQDNATPVYEGNLSWRRVIGGDGLSTAIDPTDDNIVYGSYQYLNIHKSTDKAQVFNFIANYPGGTQFCFAGPYVLCPSNTDVLYAGSDLVFKSTNGGGTWSATNGGAPLDGNPVLKLAVSSQTPDIAFAATVPVATTQFGLYRTTNGGTAWTDVTGNLPNRYIQDITIDPVNDSIAYLAIGGFGTPHLYKSVDRGATWTAVGGGLADVPANTVAVDPLNTQVVYAGNDLGIFVSLDGGMSFLDFNDGLFDATMVFDISLSPSNRMLRLATHGKGAYERPMLPPSVTAVLPAVTPGTAFSLAGNPVAGALHLRFDADREGTVSLRVLTVQGRVTGIRTLGFGPGHRVLTLPADGMAAGVYFLECVTGGRRTVLPFVKL